MPVRFPRIRRPVSYKETGLRALSYRTNCGAAKSYCGDVLGSTVVGVCVGEVGLLLLDGPKPGLPLVGTPGVGSPLPGIIIISDRGSYTNSHSL